jgi:3'(2'), 5'-bisphosphate nucleotidase
MALSNGKEKPDMKIDTHLLREIEVIAREAGSAILEIYARNFSVQEKADKSPLTEADIAAHTIISHRLSELSPSLPILSEEDIEGFSGPDRAGRYWLVDPLDGTKEFIKRNGEFTVNIALIEKGRPVLGVVFAPVLDTIYFAAQGVGAFRQIGKDKQEQICVAEHDARNSWKVVGSRSHAGDTLCEVLKLLGTHEILSMGSSLKFCMVAEGSADVYPRLGPTSLWDTAAAQCVVEQAGGRVIRLTGEPLDYGSEILNPFFIVHGRSDVNWAKLFSGEIEPKKFINAI